MKKQKTIIGVIGLPLRTDGKILLTRRYAPGRSKWHHKWQMAGGGMEFGETPEQTLAREFEEELKVSARILSSYPIVKTKVWYGDHLDSKADTHIILLCYLVDIGEQKIDISGDDETDKYDWFSFEDALKLNYLPLTDEFVREAIEIIKQNDILKQLA